MNLISTLFCALSSSYLRFKIMQFDVAHAHMSMVGCIAPSPSARLSRILASHSYKHNKMREKIYRSLLSTFLPLFCTYETSSRNAFVNSFSFFLLHPIRWLRAPLCLNFIACGRPFARQLTFLTDYFYCLDSVVLLFLILCEFFFFNFVCARDGTQNSIRFDWHTIWNRHIGLESNTFALACGMRISKYFAFVYTFFSQRSRESTKPVFNLSNFLQPLLRF